MAPVGVREEVEEEEEEEEEEEGDEEEEELDPRAAAPQRTKHEKVFQRLMWSQRGKAEEEVWGLVDSAAIFGKEASKRRGEKRRGEEVEEEEKEKVRKGERDLIVFLLRASHTCFFPFFSITFLTHIFPLSLPVFRPD